MSSSYRAGVCGVRHEWQPVQENFGVVRCVRALQVWMAAGSEVYLSDRAFTVRCKYAVWIGGGVAC